MSGSPIIIRRLRANSPSIEGTIFSLARAAPMWTERLPSHRVDRAVPRGDAAKLRLELADHVLQPPVSTLFIDLMVGAGLVRGDERDLAARVADRPIVEGGDQL